MSDKKDKGKSKDKKKEMREDEVEGDIPQELPADSNSSEGGDGLRRSSYLPTGWGADKVSKSFLLSFQLENITLIPFTLDVVSIVL